MTARHMSAILLVLGEDFIARATLEQLHQATDQIAQFSRVIRLGHDRHHTGHSVDCLISVITLLVRRLIVPRQILL